MITRKQVQDTLNKLWEDFCKPDQRSQLHHVVAKRLKVTELTGDEKQMVDEEQAACVKRAQER